MFPFQVSTQLVLWYKLSIFNDTMHIKLVMSLVIQGKMEKSRDVMS